jgi:hypothetical protein
MIEIMDNVSKTLLRVGNQRQSSEGVIRLVEFVGLVSAHSSSSSSNARHLLILNMSGALEGDELNTGGLLKIDDWSFVLHD